MLYAAIVRRLLTEEDGQDLIEYGLLLGIVTSGLIAVLPALQTRMGTAFVTLGTTANNTNWVP